MRVSARSKCIKSGEGDVPEFRTAVTAALSQRNWTRRRHQLAPQRCAATQPRTQDLYSTLLPRLRNDPGSGWSRVSQILGDYKKNSQGWVAKFILPINLSK